jgi:valyl-tRNA synthetase
VAIFVHPEDDRYQGLAGREAVVPLFRQRVPVLLDPGADPEKGTGAVMCCTFGDTTDVAWQRLHRLPLVESIDRQGRMTSAAGAYAGLAVSEARRRIKADLEEAGLLLGRQSTIQSVRVHERCDTPVEYILARQWFIRVLDFKGTFLKAGEAIRWRPEQMQARYRAWVENHSWDWCISRQRYFGVPIPAWYCQECGQTILPGVEELPVDPTVQGPGRPCTCGSTEWIPEEDVFDTWATSSMSPQIVGHWRGEAPESTPGAFSSRSSLSACAAGEDHPHLGVLYHCKIAFPSQQPALEGGAHLRLGPGRGGDGQDQ